MKIVKVGPLIDYLDAYGRAVAVPFGLRPNPQREVVSSEPSELRWIRLSETKDYDIVAGLAKALSLFGLQGAAASRHSTRSAR